jgi:hypothetical protein
MSPVQSGVETGGQGLGLPRVSGPPGEAHQGGMMQIYAICFTHHRWQHPQSQEWRKLPDLLRDWINLRDGERAILEPTRCDLCEVRYAPAKKGSGVDDAFIAQFITGPAH